MTAAHSEIVTYWRGIVGTLVQRGLLRQRRDGQKVLPQAVGVVTGEYVAFVLDMHRLGGIAREQWLDTALWAQIRATLQGRRCFVADSAGLAVVVAREPGKRAKRLPRRIPLDAGMVPDGPYTVLLGISKAGPVTLDLAGRERAVLVGGTSGSGKTSTIRTLVLQAAHKHTPEELALAIVDLKRLDFTPLSTLPHLAQPAATTEEEARRLVAWCAGEMERRQAVMTAAGVTRWDRMPSQERFPLLLLVVDECADFAGSPVMGDLVELARKGRASGVSLILATQRPDAQVLSRQVKANVCTRIAFRTTDAIESRIILDRGGAEQIRRAGLCLTNAGGRWRRVQAAYIPDEALGEWCAATPGGPALSEVERALVAYALQDLDGAFIINQLYDAHKGRISKRQLTALAQRWELRGWLTAPASRSEPRKVTDELAGLALGADSGDTVTQVARGDTAIGAVTQSVAAGDTLELPPFLVRRVSGAMQGTEQCKVQGG
jgi:energy-coupling factor transporter ATP-binding protein EcfA2